MTNNRSGIGVCGVIVGIILGAGAIIYTQDYPVKAHLAGYLLGEGEVAFRGMDVDLDMQQYSKRALSELDRKTNTSPDIVTEPRRPLYPTNVNTEVLQEERVVCTAKLRTIEQVREAVARLMPVTSVYSDISRRIFATLDSSMEDCGEIETKVQQERQSISTSPIVQAPIKTTVTPVQATIKRTVVSQPQQIVRPTQRVFDTTNGVNNLCERYGTGTQRYTRCVVNQREGQKYVGRQTTRYELRPSR
ncbi:hypothetical protein KJ652_04645 [Patescibacteria group bacterium]|nr:hypothetical protein [Patescibacteria group bacterium]MBU1123854.1 hypothetical protein [Patescibacteria group bacterium]MBU1911123.1 hypothetical protein [Patescibacteria group bacterium]